MSRRAPAPSWRLRNPLLILLLAVLVACATGRPESAATTPEPVVSLRDTVAPGPRPYPVMETPEFARAVARGTRTRDWSYEVPPDGMPRTGTDGEIFYLAYWYPQMAVYDDVSGWQADPYKGNAEFYMGYAEYDVSLTVPEGWLVTATGTLQNAEQVLSAETREGLTRFNQTQAMREFFRGYDLETIARDQYLALARRGGEDVGGEDGTVAARRCVRSCGYKGAALRRLTAAERTPRARARKSSPT